MLLIRNKRGFSVAELIVVMAVMLIVVAVATPLYANLYFSTQLDEAKLELMQKIRTAENRAQSGLGNKSYGVYLSIDANSTQDRYILYQNSNGTTYAGRSASDIAADTTVVLDQAIQIVQPTTSIDINFSKGAGVPSVTPTITLRHPSEGDRTITINVLGVIQEL